MRIKIDSEPLQEIQKLKPKSVVLQEERRYGGCEVDTSAIDHADFEIIKKVMKREEFWKDIDNRRVFKHIEAFEKIIAAGSSAVKVKKLETLPDVIKMRMTETAHRWVLKKSNSYDADFAYFVKAAKFHPYDPSREKEAHVAVELVAVRRGHSHSENVYFIREDLFGGGKTVDDLFQAKNIFVETPELLESYHEHHKNYLDWHGKVGEQFLGRGTAVNLSEDDDLDDRDRSHWGGGTGTLEFEGRPSNLVMDDHLKFGKASLLCEAIDWSGVGKSNTEIPEDEDEAEEMIKKGDVGGKKHFDLPIHPVVRMFNLKTHCFAHVHVANLKPYVYDVELGSKLVLPPDHRELADALTTSAIYYMEDIISGKAAGVIVMCSGTPGTGKTLTAEVYGEVAKRPLYTVQCSQLGVDVDGLEKNLQTVLNRAQRWKAILLIDEADVYLHERGEDIFQNAIVGVFLRLFEYFKGMMFLTTNMATVIDDAIESRLTAHLKYTVPVGDDRHKLWKILSPQFRVEMDDEMIKKAVEAFPHISGRSIRQLLKLSSFIGSHRRIPVTLEIIKHAAKFHDFNEEEKYEAGKNVQDQSSPALAQG